MHCLYPYLLTISPPLSPSLLACAATSCLSAEYCEINGKKQQQNRDPLIKTLVHCTTSGQKLHKVSLFLNRPLTGITWESLWTLDALSFFLSSTTLAQSTSDLFLSSLSISPTVKIEWKWWIKLSDCMHKLEWLHTLAWVRTLRYTNGNT